MSDDADYCPVCGNYSEWMECWACFGAGGHHDCGEDCCMCLDKEEITEDCEECHGEGGYRECIGLPHTDEQMDAYCSRKTQEATCPEGMHRWKWVTQGGTPDGPTEHFKVCDTCDMEYPGSDT